MSSTASERFPDHLIRLGALALVLSIIPALTGALDLVASVEIAIATHVVTLMMGVLFLCLGLAWDEFDFGTTSSNLVWLWAVLVAILGLVILSRISWWWAGIAAGVLTVWMLMTWKDFEDAVLREHVAFWALVLGGLTVVTTGSIAALLGVGGETLSAFDPDATGPPDLERDLRVVAFVVGLLFFLGLALLSRPLWTASERERSRLAELLPAKSSRFGFVDKPAAVWKVHSPDPEFLRVVLFRLGFFLMGLSILAVTVQGVLQTRFISVVGYATFGITALIFMALGLVWARMERNLLKRVEAAAAGLEEEPFQASVGETNPRQERKKNAADATTPAREAAEQGRAWPEGAEKAQDEGVWTSIRRLFGSKSQKTERIREELGEKSLEEGLDTSTNVAAVENLAREVTKRLGIPSLVYVTFVAGLLGNLAAVLLAAFVGLHDDPLAVVSAGWTSTGTGGSGFSWSWPLGVVKGCALFGLFFNSIGVLAFAHGIYDRPPETKNDMDERLADRLIRFGTLALVVGFLVAWLPELSRIPRLGVGTYATLLIIGPMFLCFGLAWYPVRPEGEQRSRREGRRADGRLWRLSYKKQRAVTTSLIVGAFLLVGTGMVLALLGIGGTTLSVSARGAVGSDLGELIAKMFVDGSILLVAVGMIFFWIGIGPTSRTLAQRTTWAASIVAFALILQAAFYHMYVHYRLTDPYPIRLADYGYGLDSTEVRRMQVARICDEGEPRFDDCGIAQNWTAHDRQWFYHASQGSAFELPIPYDWLMALEQPTTPFWPRNEVGLLMDPAYLQRFGFLTNPVTRYDPDTVSVNQGYVARYLESLTRQGDVEAVEDPPTNSPINNPDALPVGFARTESWVDQSNGQMVEVVGFTCAACHTSQIDYRVEVEGNTGENSRDSIARLRVEGGPANIDLGRFRRAVGVSLYLTQLVPGRFDRFADRLEEEARDERRRLREQTDSLGQVSDSLAREDADGPMTREVRENLVSLNLKLDSLAAEIDNPVKRRRLREDFNSFVQRMRDVRILQRELALYPTEEGFGRLDALGRIFNFVFGSDLNNEDNLGVADAPVNFPHLWDASRFDWVQYTASAHQPMIRNAGQSMGVFASVDMKGAGASVTVEDDPTLFTSSVNVLNVHELELLIGGCTLEAERPEGLADGCREGPPSERRFEGLKSPRWPEEVFGPIDSTAVRNGKRLYLDRCAGCHLAPPDTLSPTPDIIPWVTLAQDSSAWIERNGNHFLALNVIQLDEIGTDPRTAINFASRHVDLGELGDRLGLPQGTVRAADVEQVAGTIELVDSMRAADTLPIRVDRVLDVELGDLRDRPGRGADSMRAAEALPILIQRVLNRRYRDFGLRDTVPRDTLLMNILEGHRDPGYRVELGYRARPLNGIWATAPYLHNGSVPTLFHLLSPQSERPSRFFLGSRIFEPEWVGFDYRTYDPGYFEFDTSLPGNSNRGHSFEGTREDWMGRPGVLGPELEVEERMQIIEYLKFMGPLPVEPEFGESEAS